jgi:hypothetical protein
MKTIIIGLPYFAQKLAKSLSEYDKQNTYVALDTNASNMDKMQYLLNLLSADTIYVISGTLANSKAVSLALRLGKKVVMHWVGTDVLKAAEVYQEKNFNADFISKVTHFCEVSWIQTSLQSIGINAEIVQFATFGQKVLQNPKLPDKFSILTYISKGREEFYGINQVINLASDFPDIEINVVGISQLAQKTPKNIHLLGWVENIREKYENCVLYLRLPEHDGLAFSVLEALANGRYVGYTQKFDNCSYINNYECLKVTVNELYEKFRQGNLLPNEAGTKFVAQNFNQDKVLGTLVNRLQDLKNAK